MIKKIITHFKKVGFTNFSPKLLPVLSALTLGISRNPLYLNFSVFFAFVFLFFFLDSSFNKKKVVIISAFWFSFVYNTVTLYWISVVTIPGFIGMYIVLFIFFLVIFLMLSFVWQNTKSKITRYTFFISIWISFEYIMNFSEFNFPWFNLAYALECYLPLIQVAEIGGVFLISFLILLINIFLKEFLKDLFTKDKETFQKTALVKILIVLSILLVWLIYGYIRLATIKLEEHNFNATVVQVSIPQDIKWDSDFFDSTLRLYQEATEKAKLNGANLVIWPESAIPENILYDTYSLNFIRNLANSLNTHIFTGFPHYKVSSRNDSFFIEYYNSANIFRPDRSFGKTYYKNKLVPFGERIPLLDHLPILWKLDFGQANWEYGTELFNYSINHNGNSYKFLPNICFEIAFPLYLLKIKDLEPDFVVNITNDAWFKKTSGPYQHGIMTKFRAIESRTQYYRSANTGYSMIICPKGNVLDSTKLFEVKNITAPLYIYPNQTLYLKYFGQLPFAFIILSVIILSKVILLKLGLWKKKFIIQ